MNEITRLQNWYKSQCNGDWEHQHGISITSCDNPGWWVKVDLASTPLETKSFTPVVRNVSPEQMKRIAKGLEPDMCDRGPDWMLCEVKDKVFDGAGDPDKLQTILETFLNWAKDK
jgi:hypothetical protein